MDEVLKAHPRLAVYARVSSDEQKEGQTIDSQIAELERFASERQWPVLDIYKDEGWSGAVMARPELDRLRDDAQKGLLDIVLINDVDRLARDVTHLGIIKRDLESHAVQVMFRKLPSETSPTYNLMVNILGSFAEFEREMISDRMRRGRRHKVETRHQYIGTIPSFGYRYVPKDRVAGTEGRLEINPEEAPVVRQIFTWIDREGLSARKVVNRLNDLKIPPRKGAHHWQQSSLFRLLHNEMYAGTWHYNKNENCEPRRSGRAAISYRRHLKSSTRLRAKDKWIALELPPELCIVSREQWERVQQQLERNKAFSPRHEKHKYLLKSLIRCAGCGSRMVGEPNKGRFGYRCHSRCDRVPTIKEERLNEAVWSALVGAVLNPDVMREGIEKHRSAVSARAFEARSSVEEAEQALQKLESEEARLIEAYRRSVIDADQLSRELRSIKERRARATASTAPSAPVTNVSKTPEEPLERLSAFARENLDKFDFEEKRAFIQLLVDEVLFDGTTILIRGVLPGPPQIGAPRSSGPSDSPYFRISRRIQMEMQRDSASIPDRIPPTLLSGDNNLNSSGRIGSTIANNRGTNPESKKRIVPTTVDYCGFNPAVSQSFQIDANVPPPTVVCFVDARGRFCSKTEANSRERILVVNRTRSSRLKLTRRPQSGGSRTTIDLQDTS